MQTQTVIDSELFFRLVDVGAVFANGVLGGVVARALRFDVIGFILLAIVTGMGGGMIRDLMLNTGFPVMLTDRAYMVGALLAAALAYFIDLSGKWTNRALIVIDFLGMGCWTATGVNKALAVGLDWIPAVGMGVITAVGGGVLRDVLVNRVPSIFGGTPLYATVAILGSLNAVFFTEFVGNANLGMGVSVVLCSVLGVVARWRRWTLPGAVSLTIPRPNFAREADRLRLRKIRGWIPGEPVDRRAVLPMASRTMDQIKNRMRRKKKES
ncbi:predicted membrane protein [Corynebacterium renale]|uniref:trimeric intracellular cation channel family protein n=2 Tax=Corynebacterium renale TaxID=1724 RepID=UPI000DA3EBC8|nr:TRIC cation channel family protein [Corynebacterium renale]SQG64305.1 predicted membrane protein [Corynebacterium renale]STC94868.1 predicted membrane protein [Corynebacterium renale]